MEQQQKEQEIIEYEPNAFLRGMKMVLNTAGTIFLLFCTCTFVCNQNLQAGPHSVGCARDE